MTTFEPKLIGRLWQCACPDQFGEAYFLTKLIGPGYTEAPEVENYHCQNGCKWQLVTREGESFWHYLGRAEEA